MSQLQKLLDEKWPITGSTPYVERLRLEIKRAAFTEGYYAALQSAKDAVPSMDKGGRKDCYYNDTKFDSLPVVYGYNLAIEHATESLNKL